MSSNKSLTTKKTITTTMFSDIVKKNKDVVSLQKKISYNRTRCKLLWTTLIKLNENIEHFDRMYGELDVAAQEKLLDRLEKESKTIYDKYIECGEIDDDLEYEVDDLIDKLKDKYNIIHPSSSTLIVYTYGPNSKINRHIKSQPTSSKSVPGLGSGLHKKVRKKHHNTRTRTRAKTRARARANTRTRAKTRARGRTSTKSGKY